MSDLADIEPLAPAAARSRVAACIELTKPRIAGMVVVATAVGFYLALPAGGGESALSALLSTLLATLLTAGGANALNQYVEEEYDRQMARTAGRPLPSGRLAPADALAFGVACSFAGVLWLALQVNVLSAALSVAAIASYVFVYTPLKRVTPLCVLAGAVPGAMPPMIGWAAGSGTLPLGAWLLFAIMFFWQVAHFATIAWQYRDDYARAGFAVWPVIDPAGVSTNLHLVTHTVALIFASLLPVLYGLAGGVYAAGAIILGAAFLACGLAFVRRPTLRTARFHVRSSVTYLPLLLAVMMLDKV